MKKLGAGSLTERGTQRKISGELFLVAPAWRRARCRPVRPTRITGWRTRGGRRKVRKFVEATPGLAIGQRGTRNGGPRHVYLALLAAFATRSFPTLYPSATATSSPLLAISCSPSLATVCSFDSFQSLHRHCHCSSCALASKVTPGILVEKFGYLISYRGPPVLSLPLLPFISLRTLALRYSLHIPLVSPSLMLRNRPLLRDGRYFLSRSLLFVAE